VRWTIKKYRTTPRVARDFKKTCRAGNGAPLGIPADALPNSGQRCCLPASGAGRGSAFLPSATADQPGGSMDQSTPCCRQCSGSGGNRSDSCQTGGQDRPRTGKTWRAAFSCWGSSARIRLPSRSVAKLPDCDCNGPLYRCGPWVRAGPRCLCGRGHEVLS
jgi:hypothetical protein